MNDLIAGGIVLASGVVLEANGQWFSGATSVGTVFLVVGAIVLGLAVLRRL